MTDAKYKPAPTEPPPSYETAAVAGGPPSVPRPGPGPRPPLPLDLAALNEIRGKRVVLASASPRRKALLAQLGLRDVEIVPSTFAEDLSKTLSPLEYVLATAHEKALSVYKVEIDNTVKGEPALLIAADTIVCGHFGEILEKPKSEREHVAMLKALRDTNNGVHRVYTAVVCMAPLESAKDPGYALESHVEETIVKFDTSVTDDLIVAYVKTREGVDKAGGYGIQGLGSVLVEKIEGSYDNVVGLPLRATLKLIEKVKRPEEDMEEDLLDVDEEE